MANTYRTKFLVSLAILAVTVLLQVSPAMAQGCTTHTYWYHGRMISCTQCCTIYGCNTYCN